MGVAQSSQLTISENDKAKANDLELKEFMHGDEQESSEGDDMVHNTSNLRRHASELRKKYESKYKKNTSNMSKRSSAATIELGLPTSSILNHSESMYLHQLLTKEELEKEVKKLSKSDLKKVYIELYIDHQVRSERIKYMEKRINILEKLLLGCGIFILLVLGIFIGSKIF